MKLQVFNQDSLPSKRRGRPTVHFNTKSGVINFSSAVVQLMDLKEGDRIEVCLHEEEDTRGKKTANWYIRTTQSEAGYPLRELKQGLGFNSTALSQKILFSLEFNLSASFRISTEPIIEDGIKYWYIITQKPIKAK